MSARPDFFLIGAPKCGTTAMSEYLRSHPGVCFSRPKEPFYFSSELPSYRRVEDDRAYVERCFGHCGSEHRAVGEGSATYLSSPTAVEDILEFEPAARFIAMVRNPIDMAHALHWQFTFDFVEDEPDFETAWGLQAERRRGGRIPKRCTEPRLLQYAEVAALGSQVERLLERVRRERVRLILFDDFVRDTRRVYEDTVAFLGLERHGRTTFPAVNRSRRHRSPTLARLVRDPPAPVRSVLRAVRRGLKVASLGLGTRLDAVSTVPVERPPMRSAFRRALVEEFADEIDRLERALRRDLSHWRVVDGEEGEGGGIDG